MGINLAPDTAKQHLPDHPSLATMLAKIKPYCPKESLKQVYLGVRLLNTDFLRLFDQRNLPG